MSGSVNGLERLSEKSQRRIVALPHLDWGLTMQKNEPWNLF